MMPTTPDPCGNASHSHFILVKPDKRQVELVTAFAEASDPWGEGPARERGFEREILTVGCQFVQAR
jgi:hypothetical protein